MEQVISSLNHLEGPRFVTVYIDDLPIYSRSWQDYLDHLAKIIREINLKLKGHFISYSGYCYLALQCPALKV